jgi:hypothetical protein
MNSKPMTLAQKVLAVSQAIGCVEKNGLNQHFKFRYQAWDDVLPAVRNACVEVGVQIRPSVVAMTNEGGHVMVTMQFTVVDASSGESDTFQWFGEAKGNDDKGVQKAITSCTKYALLKYFLIPIVDDTDTDAHAGVDVAPAKSKAQSKTQKAEQPTVVDAPASRAVFAKKVFADFQEIGGTLQQFEQLKTKLASIEFPIKASDILHEALSEGCASADDVHHWIASKHKELPHPFKIG